jgi:HlyD family secretion protein
MSKKNLIQSNLRSVVPANEFSGINKITSTHKKTRSISDWRLIAIAGYAVIAVTFGVGGVWAAVAKLDEAVIATGDVSIETNLQTVEHYEGGIVREILVKEGEHIAKGQVLFRLQKVQAEASDATIQTQLDSALALEARLIAERDQSAKIEWPQEFAGRMDDAVLSLTMSDQAYQFEKQRAYLNSQTDILEKMVTGLHEEIQGITTEKDSSETQVSYLNKELGPLLALSAKQLVPTSRVYDMEREKARLEGIIGGAVADTAKAEGSIGELDLQIEQIHQKFQDDVAANLLDTRQKIADLGERARVARDVLSRNDIRAPRSGTLQNLRVFTIGQVVHPGEALVDLVPDDDPLIVEAQFLTTDIDHVYPGTRAEIRFPAFHSRTIPVMIGTLQSISHDRLFDELRRQYYFRGLISLSRADIPEEYRSRLRPGMPAEIVVAAGSRTALSYFISPLADSLRKAFREPND